MVRYCFDNHDVKYYIIYKIIFNIWIKLGNCTNIFLKIKVKKKNEFKLRNKWITHTPT